MGEGLAVHHLQVELIVLVQALEISNFDHLSSPLVTHTDAVVEVSEPYDGVMVLDSSVALKAETMADGAIVLVPFFVVGKASSKMCRHQTDRRICIIHANGDSSLVASNSGHAGLEDISMLQNR